MNSKYIHESFDSSPRDSRSPNERCQNILYKCAFEHFTEIYDVAALLLTSKSLQNSSFGANFVVNFKIDNDSIPLFNSVLSPSSCLSLQFIPSLYIMKVLQADDDDDDDDDGDDDDDDDDDESIDDTIANFVAELINTKYFCVQLRSLWLDEVTDDVVRCFFEGARSWPQLQAVNLIESTQVDDYAVSLLSQSAVHVNHLSLRDCRIKNTEIADQVLKHVAQLAQITFLDFHRCGETTDAGLLHVSSLKEIRHLDLSWCDKITDAGLLSVSSSLANMTWLSVCWCNEITDAGLEHISTLSSLTDLNLSGCIRITDAGLDHISRLCSLRILTLIALDRTTPVGIGHISKCSNMTSLIAARCDWSIDDASLEQISKLSRITHLDVSYCSKISDAGILHVAKLANLTNLDLYLCGKISDAGLEHLSRISGLIVLNIHGCNLITDEAKEKIKKSIPKCLVRG